MIWKLCHSSCETCSGPNLDNCLTCPQNACISAKKTGSVCEACPPENPAKNGDPVSTDGKTITSKLIFKLAKKYPDHKPQKNIVTLILSFEKVNSEIVENGSKTKTANIPDRGEAPVVPPVMPKRILETLITKE
jgi:hypothetical protein